MEGREVLSTCTPSRSQLLEERCIEKLMMKDGVQKIVGDQCMYGLKS